MTPHGGPEALFRLGRMWVDADSRTRLTMSTAPWLGGADGVPAAGALGVLLDDVLGQVVLLSRPDGHWAVSAELSIEPVAPLPRDGTVLEAMAEVVSVDAVGRISRGVVRTTSGHVVAIGTTWLRFVPRIPAGCRENRGASVPR